MIPKPIDQITIDDISELINNQIPESGSLEYKSNLNLDSIDDKKEFLYDITSFANASGGDIIYGVEEAQGLPSACYGIQLNTNETELRVNSIIRTGISPTLREFEYRFLSLENGNKILIFRINKSWDAPHQVILKGSTRFYKRHNNGKQIMDVADLKNAFLHDQTFKEKTSAFIERRLDAISTNRERVKLESEVKLVFHAIPVSPHSLNIKSINWSSDNLAPLGFRKPLECKYNFDGLMTLVRYDSTAPYKSYLQLFRNGYLESVNSVLLKQKDDGAKLISTIERQPLNVEIEIMDYLNKYYKLMNELNINFPLILSIAFLGIDGYRILSDRHVALGALPIADHSLIFPLIYLYEKTDPKIVFRSTFDLLWNASGMSECFNYNEDGTYGDQKR